MHKNGKSFTRKLLFNSSNYSCVDPNAHKRLCWAIIDNETQTWECIEWMAAQRQWGNRKRMRGGCVVAENWISINWMTWSSPSSVPLYLRIFIYPFMPYRGEIIQVERKTSKNGKKNTCTEMFSRNIMKWNEEFKWKKKYNSSLECVPLLASFNVDQLKWQSIQLNGIPSHLLFLITLWRCKTDSANNWKCSQLQSFTMRISDRLKCIDALAKQTQVDGWMLDATPKWNHFNQFD